MKRLFLLVFGLLIALSPFAQNVAINDDGSAPDASAMLDVKSANKGFLPPRVSSTEDIDSPAAGLLVYQTGGTAGYYYYNGADWVQIGAASDATQWTTTGSDIYYNSGNVGIGTTSPLSKLSVMGGAFTTNGGLTNTSSRPALGTSRIAGEIAGVGSSLGADDGFLRLSAGGGSSSSVKSFIDLSGYSTVNDMLANIVFGTAGTERMRINNAGNVGIGTTLPYSRLSLGNSPANISQRIALYEESNGHFFYGIGLCVPTDNSPSGIGLFGGTEDNVPTNDSPHMFIQRNTGNVGIGTTSPGAKLHIAGFGYGVAGGITMTPINDTEGGHYMTFLNTDNQWIGSIARGAGNTVAYNTSSDYRLKENVVNISASEAITRLMALRPVEYNYISDQNKTVISGFLAHEMADAGFANGVTGEKDAVDKDGKPIYQAIDTKFIIPEMVKVIQEQQTTIESLQSTVDSQQKQINELKQTVANLSKLLETAQNK